MNLRRNDGTLTIGMTDNKQKTIYLNENLNGALLYKVLCHELVHAFCFSYDLYFDEIQEEQLADFVSTYGQAILNKTDEILGNLLKIHIS